MEGPVPRFDFRARHRIQCSWQTTVNEVGAGSVFVGCGSGLGGEAGAVTVKNGDGGSGIEDDTGRGESMCGNDGSSLVPAGVSDKKETIFGNGMVIDGLFGQTVDNSQNVDMEMCFHQKQHDGIHKLYLL
ncbi:hypothetical protein D5086_032859 [Populus alba]|uniref:Uncharacterized protein n=1 Tax=Populus alba TaxID=43335 RepID=A0ACC4AG64_POPAL